MSKKAKHTPVATHTPGPWEASDIDTRGVYADGGAAMVATCHTLSLPEGKQANRMDVTAANARLIAAAPDLLAACQYVLDNAGGPPADMLSMIRAAVRKATEG